MMLYVYGLSDRPIRGRAISGLAGQPVRSIRLGGYVALAERLGERALADFVQPTAAAIRQQDAVVHRLAARVDPLLPARFGTVIDEENLAGILASDRGRLRAALRLVRGREQMTLRVFGPRTPPARGRSARSAPGRPTTGTSYLHSRRHAARSPAVPGLRRIDAAMGGLVRAQRIRRHDSGLLLASVYHLIPRGRSAAYQRKLAALAERSPIRVVASGPWPPYAFAPELMA